MDGWLHELHRKFEMRNAREKGCYDICPAHPEALGLKAINLQFLPPNTTSCPQAMDQGVIRYVCFIIFLF